MRRVLNLYYVAGVGCISDIKFRSACFRCKIKVFSVRSKGRVSLKFKKAAGVEERVAMKWRGISAEHVELRGPATFDYKWVGASDYAALHNIRLVDGETVLDDIGRVRRLDLRGRLTYVPKGCGVSGWSQLSDRSHSFTALYFDPAIVDEEMEDSRPRASARPMLYFDDGALRSTLGKLESLLLDEQHHPAVYAETLGLLAALEIGRLQQPENTPHIPESGRLSSQQENLLRDYIQTHLESNVSLGELAALVNLSRYHFARAFKKTFGLPPHRFITQCRVAFAKKVLAKERISVEEIAAQTGFSTPRHFSTVFRQTTGLTPMQFRRTQR